MAVSQGTVGRGGVLCIEVTGSTSTDNAGIGAFANPEGADCLILRATWHVITASTGAANITIGVGASTAANSDIINALAVNGSITDKLYNGHAMQNTTKTEITVPAHWDSDDYITFTGSASTAGLVGRLYVEYIRIS
jgi:hypothetical protein